VTATIISLYEVKRRKAGLEGLSATGRAVSPAVGSANDNLVSVFISGAFILPAVAPRA
jgi:hypothetical protein